MADLETVSLDDIDGKKEKISAGKSHQDFTEKDFSWNGKTFSGLSQKIKTDKIGLSRDQSFSMIDSQDVLLAVSKEDKPIAVFVKEKVVDDTGVESEVVRLKIDAKLVEDLKSANPKLEIPDATATDGFYTFEVDKLKLTQNMTIEDIQIRSASKDFALLFSALGCAIKDKNETFSELKNETLPFDIVVSEQFVKKAIVGDSVCLIDKTEPTYSSILINALQLERQKAEKAEEPVTLEFGDVKLFSMPIKTEDGEIHYLSIKQENDKTFAYLSLTSETEKKSSRRPAFFEIDSMGLEESSDSELNNPKNPSLYIGLVDKKNVVRVNVDINYDENESSLKGLHSLLKGKFGKITKTEESRFTAPLFDGAKRKIGKNGEEIEIPVYARTPERASQVVSFEGVTTLIKQPIEKITDLDEPPEPPEPPEKHPEKSTIDWKYKPKEKPKKGNKGYYLALGALLCLLSVIFPFLLPAGLVFLGVVAIYDSAAPVFKEMMKKKPVKISKKQKREKKFEKEKIAFKIKENINNKKKQKLEEKKNDILNNPKLSPKKKAKKLAKIDKKIRKVETNQKNLEIAFADTEKNFVVNEEIIKRNEELASVKRAIKDAKKGRKGRNSYIVRAVKSINELTDFQNKRRQQQTDLVNHWTEQTTMFRNLTANESELREAQRRIEELKAKPSLTSEEKQQLEDLKKKLKRLKKEKSKIKKSLEIDRTAYDTMMEFIADPTKNETYREYNKDIYDAQQIIDDETTLKTTIETIISNDGLPGLETLKDDIEKEKGQIKEQKAPSRMQRLVGRLRKQEPKTAEYVAPTEERASSLEDYTALVESNKPQDVSIFETTEELERKKKAMLGKKGGRGTDRNGEGRAM